MMSIAAEDNSANTETQSNDWLTNRAFRLCITAVLLCCLSGCNYIVLLGYMIGGPPQLEPAFEKTTKKSFTDHGVRVAVVCYAPDDLKYQYLNVDYLIAVGIAARLRQNHIDVVNPDQVRIWLEENPNWDTTDEIGAEFDSTYVLEVDISDFSLYETDSRQLYRGRSDIMVKVHEMKAGGMGKLIFSEDLSSEFPRLAPRSASEVSYDSFRSEYMVRLSEEIGRMFFPYGSGDDVGSGT